MFSTPPRTVFDVQDIQATVLRKCNRNIIPLLFSLGIVCYLDRTNLSFAALQLNRDLNLSCTIYGLGAGLFFLGYCLFQIPSQLILIRVGAPLWLSITIALWGMIAALMAAINGSTMFLIFRVLLGIAESGTFPAIWHHLSKFYSTRNLGSAYASVTTSTALAQVIGAPIAAGILTLDGFLLRGWQWLFIVEGCTTMAFAVLIKQFLPPSPADATFLTDTEKEWLQRRQESREKGPLLHGMSNEHYDSDNDGKGRTWTMDLVLRVISDWRMWWLSMVWASLTQAMYGIIFFTPMIIHSFFSPHASNNLASTAATSPLASAPSGAAPGSTGSSSCGDGHGRDSSVAVALMSTLPFAAAAGAMVLNARLAETANERHRHGGVPILLAALFMALTPVMLRFAGSVAAYVFLILAAACVWAPHGPLMSFPAVFLTRADTASVAFAFMNSVGTLGGVVSPWVLGYLADKTGGSYSLSMVVLASVLACGGVLMLCFPVTGGIQPSMVNIAERLEEEEEEGVPFHG